MDGKEAKDWRELYLKNIKDPVTGKLVYLTFSSFLTEVHKAFQSADRVQDAICKLENLKQGKKTAEQIVTEFKQLIRQADLTTRSTSDNIHLIGLFWKALNYSFAHKIMFGKVIPRMIEDWFEKAIQFDTNYQEAMAIFGQNRKNDARTMNRSWYRPAEKKDPNVMDVDTLTFEERQTLIKQESAERQGTEQLIAQMKLTGRGRRKRSLRKLTGWRMPLPLSSVDKRWERSLHKDDAGRQREFLNWRTESTSVPPSITIDNVQVAEIEKNTMTLSIKISGENIGQKTVETKTLLDTGAGVKFIDQNFIWNQKIKTKNLEDPIEVFNVDGTLNKQGTITKYTWLNLTINGCTQPHNLFVTRLGKQKIILGYPWFKQNNLEINWEKCTLTQQKVQDNSKLTQKPLIEEETDQEDWENHTIYLIV